MLLHSHREMEGREPDLRQRSGGGIELLHLTLRWCEVMPAAGPAKPAPRKQF